MKFSIRASFWWREGKVSDMDKPPQFTMAFLFQQTLLVAIFLGILRLYPYWPETPVWFLHFLFKRWLVVSLAASCVGAIIGGFYGRFQKGAGIGLATGASITGAWATYWAIQYFYRAG